MRKCNLAIVAVCVVLASYTLWQTMNFQHTIVGDDPTGPAFFPQLMACLLLALAAILTVETFTTRRRTEAAAPASGSGFAVMPLLGMAALAGYILLLEPLGFIIATVPLLLALLLFCGVRRPLILLCYPAICSIIMYYVFRKLLLVYLPEGLFYF